MVPSRSTSQSSSYRNFLPCQYELTGPSASETPYGIRNTPSLVGMKAKIEGFIALDYAARYDEARAYLADLQSKGSVNYEYTVLEAKQGGKGLDRCTEALELLFSGKNFGKT